MDNDLPKVVSEAQAGLAAPLARYLNKVVGWCRRNTLYSSSDIKVNQTMNGVTLTLIKKPNPLPNAVIFNPNSGSGASSGGGYAGDWTPSSSYAGGTIVQVKTSTVYGALTITPGTYGLRPGLTASAYPVNLNECPQFPAPTTGSVVWDILALGFNAVSVCSNGGGTVYVESSGTF